MVKETWKIQILKIKAIHSEVYLVKFKNLYLYFIMLALKTF